MQENINKLQIKTPKCVSDMARSRKHGNEISGSIKDGEFLVHLTISSFPRTAVELLST
jgi:hypothetical protein